MSGAKLALILGAIGLVIVIVLLLAVSLGGGGDGDDDGSGDGGGDGSGPNDNGTIYNDSEVFQVSLAGVGIADGVTVHPSGGAVVNDAARQQIADTLGQDFGTTYSLPSRDTIQAYTNGTNAQWCNYGWTDGATWPYCKSGAANTDITCCGGSTDGDTADWDGMNPQPGIYLYGRKPVAGMLPMCNDPSVAAGTVCIGNWSSGGSLPTLYSKYDQT